MTTNLQALLDQAADWPLLTASQERALAQRIERGREARAAQAAGIDDPDLAALIADGDAAHHEFLMSNLRLVVTFARRVPPPPGMDLDDLVQDGILGLDHAIEKFDWRRGYKFSTYATWWIRQAISRAADERGSIIRIPADRASRLRASLRHCDGDAGLLDEEQARLYWLSHPASLDQPAADDSGTATLGDFQAADEEDPIDRLQALQSLDDLGDALSHLRPAERTAIIRRFGLDQGGRRTYAEIGDELGMAGESARRLVRRAIRRLQDQLVDTVSAVDAA